jgi:Na+/H+-translocating membrane pyrophosphatase
MGSDLFGSFAEATVAALVVSGTSEELIKGGKFLYPLVISATGILVCLFTTFFTCIFSIQPNDSSNKSGKKKFNFK